MSEYSDIKQEAIDSCEKHWIKGRGERFAQWGIPLVIGKREGYKLWDIDGHEVYDLHLNGGTYNFGHRNPEVMQALLDGLDVGLDMGNHHFPSLWRGKFAEALISAAPGDDYSNVVMVNSGAEAIDLAIRTVRQATGKRKILSLDVAYHGYGSVLPTQLGSAQSAKYFNSDAPATDVDTIEWNNLDDAREKLKKGDVAGLIAECCPASAGFLIPNPGYIAGLKMLCEEYDVPYIADEVQVGMGRSANGKLWSVEQFGVSPDILVTAKALGGGLLPLGAMVVKPKYAGWMEEKPWAWTSTSSGSELACYVGLKTLEIVQRPDTLVHTQMLSDYFGNAFRELKLKQPFFKGIRQMGVIFGIETNHPQGGMFLMKRLYENGVWAIVSSLDESIVQFKPGLLLPMNEAKEIMEITEKSFALAAVDAASGKGVVNMY